MNLRSLKPFSFLLLALIALSLLSPVSSALSFTSTPPTEVVEPFDRFDYNVTFSNVVAWHGNLTMTTTAPWLVLFDWNVSGIPDSEDIGVYLVNLTLHDTIATVETYDYQNFTVEVNYAEVAVATPSTLSLVTALVLCFGLMIIAIYTRDMFFFFIGGATWLFSGLLVLLDLSVGWLIISYGVGLYMMLLAGMEHKKGRT